MKQLHGEDRCSVSNNHANSSRNQNSVGRSFQKSSLLHRDRCMLHKFPPPLDTSAWRTFRVTYVAWDSVCEGFFERVNRVCLVVRGSRVDRLATEFRRYFKCSERENTRRKWRKFNGGCVSIFIDVRVANAWFCAEDIRYRIFVKREALIWIKWTMKYEVARFLRRTEGNLNLSRVANNLL